MTVAAPIEAMMAGRWWATVAATPVRLTLSACGCEGGDLVSLVRLLLASAPDGWTPARVRVERAADMRAGLLARTPDDDAPATLMGLPVEVADGPAAYVELICEPRP